jgi:ankyrin repeat protein
MFQRARVLKVAWPLAGGCFFLLISSCGDKQQEAKHELSAKSFTFTVEEFMRAAKEGNVTALKHFIEGGMAVEVKDGEGSTALFRAAQAGRSEAVQFLLGQDARTDVTGVGFDTLVVAARSGSADTVQALLTAKADPSFRTDKNWTALTAAAYTGEVECVKRLAPLSRDSLDEALQIAALQGKTEVIDALLAAGADVFSRSRENKTPLMYAAANGHADAVRVLLLHGSNPLALENNDRTAVDFASSGGHKEIVALLNDTRPPASSRKLSGDGPASLTAPRDHGATDASSPGEASAVASRLEAPRDIVTDPSAQVNGAGDRSLAINHLTAGPGTVERTPTPRDSTPPPARLQGSTLAGLADGTTESLRAHVRMKDFRESQLPIILEEVGTEGESARIRVLGRERRTPEIVLAGGEIGETGLQLVKAERKFKPSKMGEGHPLDVSQVTVVDKATGQRHRIVRNATANSSQPAALISVGAGDEVYEVREGDEFTAGETSPARYRVLDVRPTQVIVENLDTRETATLARSYAR